ncbi:sodium-coupled monocarboxylate transporter 2-like isoform X3 [Eriocheir sinensis]|uniref:sodium-coupled monocarboxylate transporter 2-like isoform X3 n=1 Tax=Eriocheir sinensis TaxID=95602 RepID=UPI0021C8FF69|nr:sodium-coupled monocarboxylate transporter 2-like isoform X3 [Eriocheir sinensis]
MSGLTSALEGSTEVPLGIAEKVMEGGTDGIRFKTTDWAVFSLMLVASAIIGLYTAFRNRNWATTHNYLIGGGNMPPLAVALSLMGGWISAISILGNATEVYLYGTQIAVSLLGCVPGVYVVHKIILPIFYNLKIISLNEYLERRYRSTLLRKMSSFVSLLNLGLYMGMCLYAPSLALVTVTNLSTFASMAIMGAVVTFYITIGGVRAVVYTDVLQTLLMFVSVLAVVVLVCVDLGGVGEVWATAGRGGRLEFFNQDLSPYVRHTLWSTFCMGFFLVITSVGLCQTSYQRFAAVSTLKTAQGLLWFFLAGLWCLWIMFFFSGLVAYATYSTCDPLTSGKITKADQIIPFLVIDKLSHIPGISGLFVAAVYSAVLSGLSNKTATFVVKMLSSLTGVVAVALGHLIGNLGNIFNIIFSITTAISGPIAGVFLAGILLPWVNAKSAFSGFVASFCYSMWIVVGKFLRGGGSPPQLTLSMDGCVAPVNVTLGYLTTTIVPKTVDQMETSAYDISYCYNTLIGIAITMLISSLVTLITGPNSPGEVKSELLNPTSERMYRWAWRRCQRRRKNTVALPITSCQGDKEEVGTMLSPVTSNLIPKPLYEVYEA